MEDVKVEITYGHCLFWLVTDRAKALGRQHVDNDGVLAVHIGQAANYVRTIEAAGMTVTPGTSATIEWRQRAVLQSLSDGRWDDRFAVEPQTSNNAETESLTVSEGPLSRVRPSENAAGGAQRVEHPSGWPRRKTKSKVTREKKWSRGMAPKPIQELAAIGKRSDALALERKLIRWFGAALISVVLTMQLWHVAQPLVTEMRSLWLT